MRFEDETLPFGAIGSYFQRRLLVISAREKRVFSSDKDLQHLTLDSDQCRFMVGQHALLKKSIRLYFWGVSVRGGGRLILPIAMAISVFLK